MHLSGTKTMSASGGHVKKRRVSKKHHHLWEPNDSDGEKRDTDIEKRKKHRHVAEHNVTFAEETPSEENEQFPFLLNEHRSEKRKKKAAKTGEGEAVEGQDDQPEMQITSYNVPVRESEGFVAEKKQKRKDSQAEFDQVDVDAQGRTERKKRKKHRESFAEVYSACEAENGPQLSGAGGNEESPSCTAHGTEGHVAKGKQLANADDNREGASRIAGKKYRREAKSSGKLANACIESSMSDQQLETGDDVSSWDAETNQTCTPGSVRRKKKHKLKSTETCADASNLSYSPVQIDKQLSFNSSGVGYSKDCEQEAAYRDGLGTVLCNELDGLSSENNEAGVTEWEGSNLQKAFGHMPKKKKQQQLLHLSGTSDSGFLTTPSVDGSPERMADVDTLELPVPEDRVPAQSLHFSNEVMKGCAPKNKKSTGKAPLSSGSAASVPAFSSSRYQTECESESETLLDSENGNFRLGHSSMFSVNTAKKVKGATSRRHKGHTGNRRPSSGAPSAAVLEAAFYSDGEGPSSPPDPIFLEYLNGTHGYPAIHCKTKPSAQMISLYEAEQGLSLDYGKYTADEDGILLRNVHDIAAYYNIRFPYMIVGHCGDYSREVQKQVKKLVKDYNLVRMLGRGLPCRTLHSAYMRARILLDPHNEVAKYIPTSNLKEQVERLYAQMGPKWTVMAQMLGITAEQCRSVLRHDQEKKTSATGAWTKEEDDLLQQAMEEQSRDGNLKLSAIDWPKVSQCVGRRTAQQCRRRWTLLQLKPDISSAMRKWSLYDTIHLIWRMHKLNPPRSSAVDWDKLVKYFPWAQSASIPRYYWQTTVEKYLPLEDRADFQTKVKNLYERALPKLLDKHGKGRTVSEIVKLSKSSNTVPVYPRDDD